MLFPNGRISFDYRVAGLLLNEKTSDCTSDSTTLKSSALQNDLTVNPVTSSAQSKMTSALMTNKNSPKVKMVTGNVKIISTGFTKRFSSPSTMATITEVQKVSTATPGSNREIIRTSIAVTIMRIIRFMFKMFSNIKIIRSLLMNLNPYKC